LKESGAIIIFIDVLLCKCKQVSLRPYPAAWMQDPVHRNYGKKEGSWIVCRVI